MDSRLIITKPDKFLFIDVTDIAEKLIDSVELFIWNGKHESVVEYIFDIRKAIREGNKIVLAGGNLPNKNFSKLEKVLMDGYWYVKYADL
jgi:methylmalonyl-CoA mutase cobalamin-binding subunit